MICYQGDKDYMRDAERAYICNIGTVKWDGAPVGLVTAAGKVYGLAGDLVAANNAKIVPYLGHTVTIQGDVSERDGMTILTGSGAAVKLVK